MLTRGVASSSTVQDDAVPNDGTNACVFLALKICDVVLSSDCARNKDQLEKKLEELPHVASEVIAHYPEELNRVRQVSSLYSVLDAKKTYERQQPPEEQVQVHRGIAFCRGCFCGNESRPASAKDTQSSKQRGTIPFYLHLRALLFPYWLFWKEAVCSRHPPSSGKLWRKWKRPTQGVPICFH